jgi:hypothetical protein
MGNYWETNCWFPGATLVQRLLVLLRQPIGRRLEQHASG